VSYVLSYGQDGGVVVLPTRWRRKQKQRRIYITSAFNERNA